MLCKILEPLLVAVTGRVSLGSAPKNMRELISQLEDVNKQLRTKGTNILQEANFAKTEIGTLKREIEFYRKDKERMESQNESLKATIERNEDIYKQYMLWSLKQVKELKALKS